MSESKGKKRSEVVKVRVSGRQAEHLNLAVDSTNMTKAEILRRGLDLAYAHLRREYELPK